MSMIAAESEAIGLLSRSVVLSEQARAREALQGRDDYLQLMLDLYLTNPFLRLTDDEVRGIEEKVRPVALGKLVAARQAVMGSTSPKYVIFCMPKSGSSFVQSALRRALNLPLVSLTSLCTPRLGSYFGINSREQELDEAAIIKAILAKRDGFVAQHHTRYSTFLALQVKLYGVRPLVTVRNIFDCIVSMDDMLAPSRSRGRGNWGVDPQFALPADYQDKDPDDRYTILAHSFGVWLINFYLSWKRGAQQGLISPLMIRYEEDVLQPEVLVERLTKGFGLSDQQLDRLRAYVHAPDQERSRLNVGRRGRGAELLPGALKDFLASYVRMFGDELDEEDVRFLVG